MESKFEMSKITIIDLINHVIFEHAQKFQQSVMKFGIFDTINFDDKMEEFREK